MASSSSSNFYRKESPRFDGTNYKLWKERMKIHLRCLRDEIWEITEKGYTLHDPSFGTLTPADEKKNVDNDVSAKETLLSCYCEDLVIIERGGQSVITIHCNLSPLCKIFHKTVHKQYWYPLNQSLKVDLLNYSFICSSTCKQ